MSRAQKFLLHKNGIELTVLLDLYNVPAFVSVGSDFDNSDEIYSNKTLVALTEEIILKQAQDALEGN